MRTHVEEEEKSKDDITLGDVYGTEFTGAFGVSVPSDLGKNINGIISPDLHKGRNKRTKDLFMADLMCNTSNQLQLHRHIPSIPESMVKKLPLNLFLYIMFKKDTIDLDRAVSYLNDKCGSVMPFAITDDMIQYLGSYDIPGAPGKRELFVIVQKRKPTSKDVLKAYNAIKNNYSEELLRVAYGKKKTIQEGMSKYLDPSKFNSLKDDKEYLVLIGSSSNFFPRKAAKVANDIGEMTGLFNGNEVSEGNVDLIGRFDYEYGGFGKFNFNCYVVEA